jgi:type II secretory pathway component PulK
MQPPKCANPTDSEKGAALVITLWAALILCVIALDLAYSTRLELRTGAYHTARVQSRELARAGLELALAHLQAPENRSFQPALRLESRGWKLMDPAAAPTEWTPGEITGAAGAPAGALAVEIVNESGKLNVNAADRESLARMLGSLDIENAEPLADAIVAYRDSRPEALVLHLDELTNVPGVDTTLIYGEDMNNNGLLDIEENDGADMPPDDNRDGALSTGLAAHLTVSPQSLVSANDASAPVLAAVLDISLDEARRITDLRAAREQPFLDLAELAALDSGNEPLAEKIFNRLTLDAGLFTVRVKAAAPGGTAPVQAAIAVAIIDGTPAPMIWRGR